jgi:hypothetical protein
MGAIPTETRIQFLERSLATAHSRDTITKALYEVLLDSLDFGPRDLPSPEDREWLRGAVAMPLQEATDVALHSLVWNIAETFERAPRRFRHRFERSHEGVDLGWE